jgi:hypothetical protein
VRLNVELRNAAGYSQTAMKKERVTIARLLLVIALMGMTGCAAATAMPLGNDMMEVDVSAAPVYGLAGAQRMAIQKAAEATLQYGYDKFIVVNNGGRNELTVSGGSYGSYNASANQMVGNASGQEASGWGVTRHPEAKLLIHMYHNGEEGAEKAVDAKTVLGQSTGQQQSADFPK